MTPLLGRDHNHRQVSIALINGINTSFSLVETCCLIYHSIVFVLLRFFTEAQVSEIYYISFFFRKNPEILSEKMVGLLNIYCSWEIHDAFSPFPTHHLIGKGLSSSNYIVKSFI